MFDVSHVTGHTWTHWLRCNLLRQSGLKADGRNIVITDGLEPRFNTHHETLHYQLQSGNGLHKRDVITSYRRQVISESNEVKRMMKQPSGHGPVVKPGATSLWPTTLAAVATELPHTLYYNTELYITITVICTI